MKHGEKVLRGLLLLLLVLLDHLYRLVILHKEGDGFGGADRLRLCGLVDGRYSLLSRVVSFQERLVKLRLVLVSRGSLRVGVQ